MLVQRAHRIRLNPTPEQERNFWQSAGVARFVFNHGLEQWQRQYAESQVSPGVASPSEFALKKQFNAVKRAQFPFVMSVSKSVSEGAFNDLGQALRNFFRRVKQGADPGYPKYKSRKRTKPAFYLANDVFKTDGHTLRIQRCPGTVNMAEEIRFAGKVQSGRVSYDGDSWHIAITVEVESPELYRHPDESVGIDLGIKAMATLSNGEQYENQRLYKSELRKIKRLSRKLARRKAGSNRRERAKQELAKLHLKIANRRKDYIHKMTTEIAQTYRIIGIEDLNVSGMVKNHKLAMALNDVAFGETRRQLTYKSEWFGGLVVPIGRFFPSSRLCPVCGAIKSDLKLSDRVFICECGFKKDRDWNAAENIETEALRIVAGMAISTLKTDVETDVRPVVWAAVNEASTYPGGHDYAPQR